MTAIVAVKHPDPIFEGQTKTKLASADATKAVFSVTGEELQLYFDRNLETLKGIIGCAEKSARIRKAEEKAKTNMLSKSKFSFDSNGKLANCESRDPGEMRDFYCRGRFCRRFCQDGQKPPVSGHSAHPGKNPERGKGLHRQGPGKRGDQDDD